MKDYCKLWTLPGALQKIGDLSAFFSDSKIDANRKAYKVKMTASEVLCFYPILQHLVLRVQDESGPAHATLAFLQLCTMMDLLASTQYITVSCDLLDRTAESALLHFKNAGWNDYCIKKFHWLLHYGDALQTHNMLLPCWAMERKHKDITSVATRISNLKGFEEAVSIEVLSQQLHSMKNSRKNEAALQQPAKAPKRVLTFLQSTLGVQTAEIFIGKQLVLVGGGLAMNNDIVLFKNDSGTWDGGKLFLNFAIGLHTWSLVSPLVLDSYDKKKGHAAWTATDKVKCVAACDILLAVTYCRTQRSFKTLVPFHLR
eukprot:Skav203157  [mRNA]  locus=scaffold626:578027:578968:- [translate_table: standard]